MRRMVLFADPGVGAAEVAVGSVDNGKLPPNISPLPTQPSPTSQPQHQRIRRVCAEGSFWLLTQSPIHHGRHLRKIQFCALKSVTLFVQFHSSCLHLVWFYHHFSGPDYHIYMKLHYATFNWNVWMKSQSSLKYPKCLVVNCHTL